jgi:hypothetical protein
MFSLEHRRECYRTLPKLCRSTYSRKDSNNYSDCRLRSTDMPETHNFFFTGGNFKSRRFTVTNQWTRSWATVVRASTLTHSRQRLRRLHLLYVRYFEYQSNGRTCYPHIPPLSCRQVPPKRWLSTKLIGVPPQKIWMSKCQFPFSFLIFQLVVLQDVSPQKFHMDSCIPQHNQ